jgi:hypothetical protein
MGSLAACIKNRAGGCDIGAALRLAHWRAPIERLANRAEAE